MKVAMNGVPGWLGDMVQKKLYDCKDIDLVRTMYFNGNGEHPYVHEQSKIQYMCGNVLNYDTCLELTDGIDTVVHIVGVIHPKKVKDFYNINVKGTDNMLRASIANGVKRFIHISSNSAYGVAPYTMNEYTPNEPYMNYGKSKSMAEDIIISKCMIADIDYIILRPCWFYGPGQPNRQTKLFKMIAKGKPMIFGKGDNMRSMTYIGNLADAIVLSVTTDKHEALNEDYWIADEDIYTTNQIYETIFEELWKAAKIDDLTYQNYKPKHIPAITCTVGRLGDKILQKLGIYNQYVHVLGEMDQNIACDITKAKLLLRYNPKVSLAKGMMNSIKWCIEHGKLD